MRVVVADDSVLLREGIVRILSDSGFDVVGQAGDAEDLVRKVAAHKPDVAIVDVRMPPTNTDDGLQHSFKGRNLGKLEGEDLTLLIGHDQLVEAVKCHGFALLGLREDNHPDGFGEKFIGNPLRIEYPNRSDRKMREHGNPSTIRGGVGGRHPSAQVGELI